MRAAGFRIQQRIPWKLAFSAPQFVRRLLLLLKIGWDLYLLVEQPEYRFEESGVEGAFGRPIGEMRQVRNPDYNPEKNREIARAREVLQRAQNKLKSESTPNALVYVPGISVWLYSAIYFYRAIAYTSQHTGFPFYSLWLLWLAMSVPLVTLVSFIFLLLTAIACRTPLFLVNGLILRPIGFLLSKENIREVALSTSYFLLLIGSLIDIALS